VCLTDGYDTYVVKAPKKLKPAETIALTGAMYSGDTLAPFEGSATLNAAGTVAQFGIFVHCMLGCGFNFTAEWSGDTTFAGSGSYDDSGIYEAVGPITFAVTGCSTVAIP